MPLKIMSLTDAAAERVREIMEDSETPRYGRARLGIKNAGCAGRPIRSIMWRRRCRATTMSRTRASMSISSLSETLFLLGTVMDFEEDMLKSGFTFKNPNQTGGNAAAARA